MFYFLLILCIGTSAETLEVAKSGIGNNETVVLPVEKKINGSVLNTTDENVHFPEVSSISTPALLTKVDSSGSALIKNTTKLTSKTIPEKLENKGATTNNSGSHEVIITEGGSVSTLAAKVNTPPNIFETSTKTVLTEGGQINVGDKVVGDHRGSLSSQTSSNISVSEEEVSSMNHGKVTARKGVGDPKIMKQVSSENNSNLEKSNVTTTPPPLVNLKDVTTKPTEIVSTSSKSPKPVVTDGRNDSGDVRTPNIDYIVPIVCTAFSVPLLVVLAVYLYKKGSDFWERRHYNRMDFLIEGIYNE